MEKLYVSCPLTGRKYEDAIKTIKKMKAIAEIVFEQEFEVINFPKVIEIEAMNEELLKQHISDIMNADYFVGFHDCWGPEWPHCDLELGIAKAMNIPCYTFALYQIAEDCEDIRHKNIPMEPIV